MPNGDRVLFLNQGYTRTFGMRLQNGERREWLKPIMFSAGIGQVRAYLCSSMGAYLKMLKEGVGGMLQLLVICHPYL